MRAKLFFIHAILLSLLIFSLLPLTWMVGVSFKTAKEIFTGSVNPLPHRPTVENYALVMERSPLILYFLNTLKAASLVTGILFVVSIFAAYGFSFFRFMGRDFLFYLFLLSLFVPFHVRMIPNYLLVSELDWVNTPWGIAIPQAANALGVFLLRQGMKTIPRSLVEAALVDRAGHFEILFRVILPLLKPALAALCITFFVNAWNEYYWPLLVVSDKAKYTLPLFLRMYVSEEGGTAWGAMMAASTLVSLPLMVLYLFTQRFIIETYLKSGIKG